MMNQNQCVPSWEVQDVPSILLPMSVPPSPPPRGGGGRSNFTAVSTGPDISLQDYEVTELTWENGQLTMHGLRFPRVTSKANLASGTLESIVNQTPNKPQPTFSPRGACNSRADIVPWLEPPAAFPSVLASMDALVPSANGDGCSATRVGSCSAAARVPVGSDLSGSAWESTRRKGGGGEDTCRQMSGGVNGLTSTSTSFGASLEQENTKTDDHDSVCHSRPHQKGRGEQEEEERTKKGKSKCVSTKRSRSAAVHNQSERKRRDKINERMKTLQKLVPNSNKTDKASMLDEVIEYVKNLQAQVQMMNRMNMPSMMMPMPIMSQMGMGMGMGMGVDQMNAMSRQFGGMTGHVAFMPVVTWDVAATTQPAMLPIDPLSAFLASQQSQPMTMDMYSRMAAMNQQLQLLQQQQQQQISRNSNN